MPKKFDFWKNVDVSAGPDGCWPWVGGCYKTRGGYGMASRGGKTYRAHRLAFELVHGRKPEGFVCHTCDNPPCCNPSHLFEGTPAENMKDKISKWRHRHGERHPKAKLTEKDIFEIRNLRAAGETLVSLGARFGVCHSTIGRIVTDKNWVHL